MRLFILLSFIFISANSFARTYYVSTTGNNNNTGTITSPFLTFEKLNSVLLAGDSALIRGGTYRSTYGNTVSQHCAFVNLTGNSGNYIFIGNYQNEVVIFDLSNIHTTNNDPTAWVIGNCKYVHWKGVIIQNLWQVTTGLGLSRGIDLRGSSNCIFELMNVNHISGYGYILSDGSNDNLFKNCDASYIADSLTNDPGANAAYGNANGFMCTGGSNATRNTWDGCRAFYVSDDGWDFYGTNGYNTLTNCWSFHIGYFFDTFIHCGQGDGNGFKLGPAADTLAQHNNILRVVTNCLAFENYTNGFDQNAGNLRSTLYNNTAYRNGVLGATTGYGFFWGFVNPPPVCDFKNNMSYANRSGDRRGSETDGVTNSWNIRTPVSADFQNISSVGMDGSRGSDGSLPYLPFMRLAGTSTFINAGTITTTPPVPYTGTAPDIDCFEYAAAPTANAGADISKQLPVVTATLSGSGTGAATPLTYLWKQYTGASITITNTTAPTTSVQYTSVGSYGFELTVTDATGAMAKDSVILTVTAAAATAPTCSTTPTANITLPTNSVALVATGASTSGNTVSYLWTRTSGSGAIANANTANATAINLTAGVSVYNVLVTDNGNGLTCNSSKTITVNAAPNLPPTANAGADQQIFLPTTSVTLTGSGTDQGGTINGYAWVQVSGNSSVITFPTQATTTVTGLTAGVYLYQLIVQDNLGAQGRDSVTITVQPQLIAPIANAGADATITLPTNTIGLSGSGTTLDNSTITSYLWTKISGTGSTIVSPTSASTSAINLSQGTYLYELKVGSSNGLFGRDTMMATVNPAPILTPPSVNAGVDQSIQLPTSQVTVTGIAVPSSGSITSYLWQKVSGGTATITSPSTASTTITGLTTGVYKFSFTAVQTNGQTATDTMVVNVAAANSIPATGIKYLQASLLRTQVSLGWTSTITANTKYFVGQQQVNGIYKDFGANIIPSIKVQDYWAFTSVMMPATYYFRIKVVDGTGTTYSPVVKVVKKK